jgi:hypothetical protein
MRFVPYASHACYGEELLPPCSSPIRHTVSQPGGLLRKELAKSIHLFAHYNTMVRHSPTARLRGEGDAYNKQSRGYAVSRTRKAISNETMALNACIKHGLYLQRYEPTIGGRFPVSIY